MRKAQTIAIPLAILSVAMPILAWIASPETLSYGVKFALLLTAFTLIGIAGYLTIGVYLFERRKQIALDGLSGEIEWATHNLLNRPMQSGTPEQWSEFSKQLKIDYDEWCAGVDNRLADRSFFSKSDAIRYKRLGVIEPLASPLTPDHTWSMIKLKVQKLQEVIDLVQQRQ